MKIVSIVGARPQFVKLKPVAAALHDRDVEHLVIHTGQHYDADMSDIFFEGLSLPPVHLNLEVGSGSQGKQTGETLMRVEASLVDLEPDWVVVYGDTNATLAGALAAVKLGFRIAHVEAGLRSWNRSMPEEINRVLTDHAADLLFAPTELAMGNLRAEGLVERAHLVGDVMADLLLQHNEELPRIEIPGFTDQGNGFLVATIHRVSNTDDEQQLRLLVSALASFDLPVALVAHPRLRAAAKRFGLVLEQGSVQVVEPLGYLAMTGLVAGSRGLITDSGGLQKEAFLLGVPCTTLRTETEWPETLSGGMNVLDPRGERLEELASRRVDLPSDQPYGDGRAAQRIADILSGAR